MPSAQGSFKPVRFTVYMWYECVDGKELWYADCVTFDLLTTRPSFDGAREAILEQIKSYVETAALGDSRGLLPRPSPLRRRLSHWFGYHFGPWFHRRPPMYRDLQDQPFPKPA
jgi:hypothetical protein